MIVAAPTCWPSLLSHVFFFLRSARISEDEEENAAAANAESASSEAGAGDGGDADGGEASDATAQEEAVAQETEENVAEL